MRTSSADEFVGGLKELARVLRTAKRNRLSLSTHRFYAPKARACLARVRKSFLMLRRDYPDERFPRVAFQLAVLEPLVSRTVEIFPSEPRNSLRPLDGISFKGESGRAAGLDTRGSRTASWN